MRALITGGAGFIGSHLAERLLEGGAEVRAVDRLSDYYDPAIKRANLSGLEARAGFESIEGDLSELDVMNVFNIVKKDFNIDPKRTYLAGQSMGGGGTFYLGIKHPEIWAALAAADPAVTGGPEQLRSIPTMPVIVIQGDQDRLVRTENTRRWVDEMKSLGMTFEYIEVPGGDHMVPFIRTPENMRKVFDFLDAHPKN